MKTVNLELAKQLKKAGYPENTKHYHVVDEDGDSQLMVNEFDFTKGLWKTHKYVYYASPTADEMLDQLHGRLQIDRYESGSWGLYWRKDMTMFSVSHKINNEKTLADAAAKMYLFLKKENLL